MCETNEEAMTDISTVNLKEEEDIFVDKVIEDNDYMSGPRYFKGTFAYWS